MLRRVNDVSVELLSPAEGRLARVSVYTRALGALLLPLLIAWFAGTVYADVLREQLSEWRGGAAVAAILLAILAFLECRWLGVLVELLRLQCQAAPVVALRRSERWIRRRRRRRFQIAAVAISVSAAFASAEAVFRLLDIRPAPPPSTAAEDCQRTDNRLNELGLREPPAYPPPPDGRIRIAFLGDSIVYGEGVEPYETFPHVVEELLAPQTSAGVLAINMGFSGTSPGWQLDRFVPLRDAIKPDVVVQVVYPNDLQIHMHHRLDEIYRIRDGDLVTGNWSYVLRYAERQVRYWVAWNRAIDYFRGGVSDAERRAAWAKFQIDLRACRDAVRESGAAYAVVLFPWLVRLNDYPLKEVHSLMGEFVSTLDVPYLDLLDTFAGRDAELLRVSLANEHPNVEGHRIAAERVARFLQEEVLPSLSTDPSTARRAGP